MLSLILTLLLGCVQQDPAAQLLRPLRPRPAQPVPAPPPIIIPPAEPAPIIVPPAEPTVRPWVDHLAAGVVLLVFGSASGIVVALVTRRWSK